MNQSYKNYTILILVSLFFLSCNPKQENESDNNIVKQWDTLILDFEGTPLTEKSDDNPFLDYRLEVVFSHKNKTYQVPGYFAADGNAAETSATQGNIWRVKFNPNELGDWTYRVIFKKGKEIAIADDITQGIAIGDDGKKGTFKVEKGNFSDKDFRSQGQLTYQSGATYQQFAGSKKYFIKGGAGSPENFLAFQDFDGTRSNNPEKDYIKTYAKHILDFGRKVAKKK